MTDFNWSAYDRWCNRLEAKAAPHEDCHCEGCHEGHIAEGVVEELAGSPDYPCCTDQMDLWFEQGWKCPKHPASYCEPVLDEKKRKTGIYCEGCEGIDKNVSVKVQPNHGGE